MSDLAKVLPLQRSYEITVPLSELPPSMNARLHFRRRASKVANARAITALYAREARQKARVHQPFQRADVAVTVTWPSSRKGPLPDADNTASSVKPLLDSLVGIWLVDDSPKCIRTISWTSTKHGDRLEVVFTITPVSS